ncbi:hypothetical protein LG329_02675 [Virgibacillus necropolis]|uniref:hypothetical protein n=1 Tax=Virgibacillus necropolis TaxID=163877 RepID=UPI00384ECF8F
MAEEDRITTIINELNYWKRNKMLPAVYCDYLLALYTNGDGSGEDEQVKHAKKRRSTLTIAQFILLILLLPIAILVIYSTFFQDYIQLGVLMLFILYSFWQFRGFKLRQNSFYHLSFAIFLLLIFLTTIFLSNTYIVINWFTELVMIMNFVCWIIVGTKMELKYLLFASIFGILLVGLFFVL